MKRLLERMAAIEHMERGKLCQMPGRKYYNLQVWRNGRNEVRYVPSRMHRKSKRQSQAISCSVNLRNNTLTKWFG